MPTVLLITLYAVGVLAVPTLLFGIAAGNAGWHRPVWRWWLRHWRRWTGQKPHPAHVRGAIRVPLPALVGPEEPSPGPDDPGDENPVDEPTPVGVLHLAVYDPAEFVPTLPASMPSQAGFGIADTHQFPAVVDGPAEPVERGPRDSKEETPSWAAMNTAQFHAWFWRDLDGDRRETGDEPGTGDALVGAR